MNTTSIISIGRAAPILNMLPDDIRKVAAAAGVSACITIDGREYYLQSDIHRLADTITTDREKRCLANSTTAENGLKIPTSV